MATLESLEAKIDALADAQITWQNNLTEKLWGKNGFEGDIPEVKRLIDEACSHSSGIADNMVGIDKRLSVVEDWKTWVMRIIVAILGAGTVGGSITAIVRECL